MTTRTATAYLEQIISACRVVGSRPDVSAITVVAGRRLTYDELARVREHAVACNVHLTMDGDGAIRLSRSPVVAEAAATEKQRRARGSRSGRCAQPAPLHRGR